MSPTLAQERCWTHPAREAAARCPSCARFFCRECVTEHDGRLICAGCLRDLTAVPVQGRRAGHGRRIAAAAERVFSLTASVLAAWLFFHLLAQTLISLPSEFHAGTLWQKLVAPTATGGDE